MKIQIVKKQTTQGTPLLYVVYINMMYHSLHDTIEEAIIEVGKVKEAFSLSKKYTDPVVFEIAETYDY